MDASGYPHELLGQLFLAAVENRSMSCRLGCAGRCYGDFNRQLIFLRQLTTYIVTGLSFEYEAEGLRSELGLAVDF